MTLNKKLLIGAATAAMTMTGAANALNITAVIGGDTIYDWTASPANTPYLLATERTTPSASGNGVINVVTDPTSGTFPLGNVIVTFTLGGGATFGANGGATLQVDPFSTNTCGATFIWIDGGAKTDTTARFLASNLSGCGVGDLAADVPISMPASGNATFSVLFATEGGTPIDGGAVTMTAVQRTPAIQYKGVANPTTPTALLALPTFTTLSSGATAVPGGVVILRNIAVNTDMAGTNMGALAVILAGMTAVTTGANAGYSDATFDADGAILAASFGANTINHGAVATGGLTTVTTTTAFNTPVWPGDVNLLTLTDAAAGPLNVPILASSYSIALGLTYNAGFSGAASTTLSIGTVARQGTGLTFPWTSTATQGALSGSTNVIRVGNVGGTTAGRVLVQALNSSCGFTVPTPIVEVAPSIAAGGEVLMTSASLEAALGNFCRGDVEVTVESLDTSVTANRFIINSTPIQGQDAGRADKYSN